MHFSSFFPPSYLSFVSLQIHVSILMSILNQRKLGRYGKWKCNLVDVSGLRPSHSGCVCCGQTKRNQWHLLWTKDEPHMLPSTPHFFPRHPCFKEDNAKPHSAHITKGLSSTEHVWRSLKQSFFHIIPVYFGLCFVSSAPLRQSSTAAPLLLQGSGGEGFGEASLNTRVENI